MDGAMNAVPTHRPALIGQAEDDPRLSTTFHGEEGSLEGWVVADSLIDSMAMGGTRMTSSVSEAEVRALARGMTLKLALVGLPIGGAKAGIVLAPGLSRYKTLQEFGRTVAPLLRGGIHLGCDLGVSQADRGVFHTAAGYDVRRHAPLYGLPMDWATYWRPLVDITGFGIAVATTTAFGAMSGKSTCRVVVQGFGTVGRAVARFLEERGHCIVGVADVLGTVSATDGLPVKGLLSITDPFGTMDRSRLPDSVEISAEQDGWLDVDADVLILAANKDALHGGNVHRIGSSLIVEGGNLCASPRAKQALDAMGITVVPDVVANVGAAAAGGCALTGTVPAGLRHDQIPAWLFNWVGERIRRNTKDLLQLAASDRRDPVATLLAARPRTGW